VFDCDALGAEDMGERSTEPPTICLEFAVDRLLPTKLQQAYELLLADRVRLVGRASNEKRGDDHEARNDLRKGSSDKQKEEHTIASQTEALRAFALQRSRRGKRRRALQGSVNVLCGAPYGDRYIR
jgi:hypothetical protein